MTLNELIEEVYIITKRRDLVDLTKSKVKAATLKCHQFDFWSKDLFETGIVFALPEYFQALDLSVIPNYRALKYLRKYDNASSTPGIFLDIKTPDNIVDRYGVENTDLCYVGGAVINIKSSTLLQYMLGGFYINPTVTDAGFDSWIASTYPYAIIHQAAQDVFQNIGKDTEARAEEKEFQDQSIILVRNNTVDVGM